MSISHAPTPAAEPRTLAFAELKAGTVVDAYFRAAGPTPAALTLVSGATPVARFECARTDAFEHVRLRLAQPVDGLAWDAATTDLSVVYAYRPEMVLRVGVDILHAGPAGTPEALEGYHFRPPFGWMNDPNGFGRFGGLYHLCYQHYPHACRWHAMHWGHAVSDDLLRWRHLPVLLDPSEETHAIAQGHGGAFSGSAIALAGRPGFRAFFTDHVDGREPEMEVQCAALSPDGVSVEAPVRVLAGRPAGLSLGKDNRDPYVFAGPDGRLRMLLGSRDEETGVVLLYATDDPDGLGGWGFAGRLYREPEYGRTVAECPSLVPLDGPAGDPATRWALVFGLLLSRDPSTRRRNLTMAVVGRFDGRAFVPEFRQELDFITDAYGFQAFADAGGPVGGAVAIAWLANWTDVDKARDWPTAMTLPRRLVLDGDRLLTPPIPAVETLRRAPLDAEAFLAGATVPIDGRAEIELDLGAPGAPVRLEFEHPTLILALETGADGLVFRYADGTGRTHPDYRVAGAAPTTLSVFVDRGSIEVFADGGRHAGAKRLPGTEPVSAVRLVQPSQSLNARLWSLAR